MSAITRYICGVKFGGDCLESVKARLETNPKNKRGEACSIFEMLVGTFAKVSPTMQWEIPVWQSGKGQYVRFCRAQGSFQRACFRYGVGVKTSIRLGQNELRQRVYSFQILERLKSMPFATFWKRRINEEITILT